jgi:hypothetical protein
MQQNGCLIGTNTPWDLSALQVSIHAAHAFGIVTSVLHGRHHIWVPLCATHLLLVCHTHTHGLQHNTIPHPQLYTQLASHQTNANSRRSTRLSVARCLRFSCCKHPMHWGVYYTTWVTLQYKYKSQQYPRKPPNTARHSTAQCGRAHAANTHQYIQRQRGSRPTQAKTRPRPPQHKQQPNHQYRYGISQCQSKSWQPSCTCHSTAQHGRGSMFL